MKKTEKISRGRPKQWTDKALKQLALNAKYKHHGVKITPSLLEKETGIGRNTWSRRLKDYILELNTPISAPELGASETLIPSVELICKKHNVTTPALINELLELEILCYDLYKKQKDSEAMKELYEKDLAQFSLLQEEILMQKMRAAHFEHLYNTIVVSSVYPHLQKEEKSQVYKLGIKNSLIDMEHNKDFNSDISNLSSYFPNINNQSVFEDENNIREQKKSKNMKKLLDEFDM